jgi:hypothetical protein
LNYDKINSMIDYKEELTQIRKKFVSKKQLARWVVMLIVGVLTALVAVVIDFIVEKVSSYKYLLIADSKN